MNTVKNMRIETNRLIIRPYRQDDLMECFQLMQDKKLFKYMDMDVMTFEEYKGLFNWIIDCYNTNTNEDFKYSFSITLKECGTHVGWCGIGGLEYNHTIKEIFYLIGREHWGNGYAKEATVALLDYSFDTIGLNEVVAICKPGNIASQKVMKNMGLKFKYIVEGLPKEFDFYNGEPFFSLTKDEYQQR